ncbi:hypothetical protein SAMN02910409_0677 [Prevotellaceae bacterium HUN156]|nr:hypothetical protein SAMN02910409_0677 [Prevotellaceae bacterium HUN156]
MKAYLDNNVLVDIEARKYSVEMFLARPDVAYYYSDAHMNELLEAKGNPKVSQEGRLKLISKLCGRNNILTGVCDVPEIYEKEPIEMYRLCDNPFRAIIAQQVNTGDELFMELRDKLGFDSTIFNNVSPDQVLGMIDEKAKQKLNNIDLLTYLRETEAFGGKPLYHTLFNLIDSANYWGDKKTAHSNVARLYDAAHAYFAQVCDILVTNDKRMRAKTKAVYSFLGVKTNVLSTNEYLRYKF